jgi:hypothetical protein
MLTLDYYWPEKSDGWTLNAHAKDDGIDGIRVSIIIGGIFGTHIPIDEVTQQIDVRLQRIPIPWIETRSNKWWILHLDRLNEELAPEHRRHWLSGAVLRAPTPTLEQEVAFGISHYRPMVQFYLYPGVQLSASRVFLVHGQNEAVRESTARLLQKLGLDPIILNEQLNEGRTLIEKLENHADVAYAVVLLTADDSGGERNSSVQRLNPRARQNVILELGFFLSKLGRDRVCVLYEEGVEMPSDFRGVVYYSLDTSGAWRQHLARELRGAGLPVDMNKL